MPGFEKALDLPLTRPKTKVTMMVRDWPQREVSMVIRNDGVRWVIGTSANVSACLLIKATNLLQKIGWNVYSFKTTRSIFNCVDDFLGDLMIEYDYRDDPIF